MSGTDVRTLQADLTKAGFNTPAVGVFGPITAQNVKGFERKYHLAANGVASQRRRPPAPARHLLRRRPPTRADGHRRRRTRRRASAKRQDEEQSKKSATTTTADPTSVLSDNPVLAPVVQDGGSEHLGERTLKQGMKGHDVRVLQSYLTLAGFPTDVDGDFGPTTETNVVKFEQANGLTTDGVMTYAQSQVLRQVVAKSITSTGPVGKATLNSDGTVPPRPEHRRRSRTSSPPPTRSSTSPTSTAAATVGGTTPDMTAPARSASRCTAETCCRSPEDSTELESYGSAGPGQWITIYADAAHTFIVVAGLAFDTAHYGPTTPGGTGPRWLTAANATANLSDGGNYIVRHPSGL